MSLKMAASVKTIYYRNSHNEDIFYRVETGSDGYPRYRFLGSVSGWRATPVRVDEPLPYDQLWHAVSEEDGKELCTDMIAENHPYYEEKVARRIALGWKRKRELPEEFWCSEEEWKDLLYKSSRR